MPKNSSINQALKWGSKILSSAKIPNPLKESSLILQFSLGIEQPIIILKNDSLLTQPQYKKYQVLILSRSRHMPFAYLTSHINFYNYNLFINPNVLIPRPETELFVENILKTISLKNNLQKLKIAEIGTGSGAISIALAKSLPNIKITASDISSPALKIAQKNISNQHLKSQIKLIKSDLLNKFPANSLDIIIANLPYVPTSTLNHTEPELSFEPRLSLDGGNNGFSSIQKLLTQSSTILRPRGIIFLEIWHTHPKLIKKTLKTLYKNKTIIIKDLSNLPRFVIIEKI